MIALMERGDPGAGFLDDADTLVAENTARCAGRDVALEYVKVSTADPPPACKPLSPRRSAASCEGGAFRAAAPSRPNSGPAGEPQASRDCR